MMDNEDKLFELKFNVVRSVRYHDFRRRAFDLLNKIITVLLLIFGSGAIAALLQSTPSGKEWALYCAVAAAILGSFNVVLGSSSKIAFYGALKNKHADLLTKIESCKEPTDEKLLELQARYSEIEKDEPSISDALNRISFNQAVDALGLDKKEKKPVSVFDYLLAYF